MIISPDETGQPRLTQMKFSMFGGKGFGITKGEAKFPTDFELVDSDFN